MPFVETKDVRMRYELDGPAGAPVLVLSNALGTNLSLWDPQFPAFAQHFRVLRYDSRGHGQTSATQGEYSAEMLGRDVLLLLDALNLERVNFCGVSIGGMTGMWLGSKCATTPAKPCALQHRPKNWEAGDVERTHNSSSRGRHQGRR